MAVFALDIGFDPNARTSQNGSAVRMDSFNTTLSQTRTNAIDVNGVPRSPQEDQLATSLGTGAVSPFQGGVGIGAYSQAVAVGTTALGYHTIARVSSSTAVGDQAQALAYRAIAIGKNANASGTNSIAIGTLANSQSPSSVSIGNNTKSSGSKSVVIGNSSNSSAATSVVIGDSSFSTASSTVTIGQLASTTAQSAVAIGVGATANGADSTIVGAGATGTAADTTVYGTGSSATGTNSIAIGNGTVVGFAGSIGIGRAVSVTGSNQFISGSPSVPMADVWFGQGNQVAIQLGTVAAWTLHGEESAGSTNSAGGDLNLAGGRGTGNATAGIVNIQVATVGASGSTLETLATRLAISASAITAQNGAIFVGDISGNFSGTTDNITISHGGAESFLGLNSNAGNNRDITTFTANSPRWVLIMGDTTAESGGNAGSDFDLKAYDDAGVNIDTPIQIGRAGGSHILLNRPTDVSGTLSATSTNFGITINYLDHSSTPQTISF